MEFPYQFLQKAHGALSEVGQKMYWEGRRCWEKTSSPSLLGTLESCRAVRSIAAKENGVCRQLRHSEFESFEAAVWILHDKYPEKPGISKHLWDLSVHSSQISYWALLRSVICALHWVAMEFIGLSSECIEWLLSKEKEMWFAGLPTDLRYANSLSRTFLKSVS